MAKLISGGAADVANFVADAPDFQPFIRATPQQRQQFLLGGRVFTEPFWPVAFSQHDRHAVMDFRHRIVRRAGQHRAVLDVLVVGGIARCVATLIPKPWRLADTCPPGATLSSSLNRVRRWLRLKKIPQSVELNDLLRGQNSGD